MDIIIGKNTEPEYLQDKIIWNGYKYVCEIDLLQLDTMSEKIGFFDDSFGYLFIKSNWIINENCGAFLMQST